MRDQLRALSTEALLAREQELSGALDRAFATGQWRADKKQHTAQQIELDAVREELFVRGSKVVR